LIEKLNLKHISGESEPLVADISIDVEVAVNLRRGKTDRKKHQEL